MLNCSLSIKTSKIRILFCHPIRPRCTVCIYFFCPLTCDADLAEAVIFILFLHLTFSCCVLVTLKRNWPMSTLSKNIEVDCQLYYSYWILERLGIQTSSSFVKIDMSVFQIPNFKANFLFFLAFIWLCFLPRNYWS